MVGTRRTLFPPSPRASTTLAVAAALAVLLGGCGGAGDGGDPTTEVNSAAAEHCTAVVGSLRGQATATGGDGSGLDAGSTPGACQAFAAETGQQSAAEAPATSLPPGPTDGTDSPRPPRKGQQAGASGSAPAPVAPGSSTSPTGVGSADSSGPAEDRCADVALDSGKPSDLPVGNSEFRIESVDLRRYSRYANTFFGYFTYRYLGSAESSAEACTAPHQLLVYRDGKKVATIRASGDAPFGSNEARTRLAFTEGRPQYVEGPYTFVFRSVRR